MAISIFLSIHNFVRWIVLLLALLVLWRAYRGWLGKKPWEKTDRMAGMMFTSSIDIQLLLGIILIFLRGLSGIPGRFYMEHVGPMVLAVVFGHLSSALSKRVTLDVDKHRRAAIWFTLSALVILVAIPWAR